MIEQKTQIKHFRQEIIEKNMVYRKDLMEISYSKHCLERLDERLSGSLKFLPKFIRITESNIASGASIDGTNLLSATVRINYKADAWCFLVVNLSSKKVITVYFRKKGEKNERKKDSDI